MTTAVCTVLHTEALLLEILHYLDPCSLGRFEQVAWEYRDVASRSWSVHAKKIHGHLCMEQDLTSPDYKEQVRRHCLARTFSRHMTREHRRHFLQASTYILPRSEPEVAPNCSYCNLFPNLQTSKLLSKNVISQAFFVQLTILRSQDESSSPKTILEGFVPVQEIDVHQKYARLRLSLRESMNPNEWPSLSHFLEGCRLQAPREMQQIWFPTFSKQLLAKLEVTVTAIDRKTGRPSLIVATGGGTASLNDLLHWTLLRRRADAHPTLPALGFGVIPTVETKISFLPDYSNLDALELTVT